MELIEQLEQENKAFVIAPDQLSIGRMERNVQRLDAYYQYAERASTDSFPSCMTFCQANDAHKIIVQHVHFGQLLEISENNMKITVDTLM